MPACSGKVPFYRDLAILLSTRWLFKKTVFHFRSAGIDEVYVKLNAIEKMLFKLAYNKPDLAIQLSASNPPDAEFIKAKQNVIVPNGITDHFPAFEGDIERKDDEFKILYIGSIRRSKGVLDIVEACNLLKEKYNFKLYLVGQFATKEFEDEIFNYIQKNKLGDHIQITGVLVGREKWRVFAQSDLLCFPTFYENESFGNVLLEAMQFRLPIVATNWRAVSTIIKDGENGFLVPVRQPKLIAQKIEYLINNPAKRKQIGRAGRKEYLRKYSVQKFWENMENALIKV